MTLRQFLQSITHDDADRYELFTPARITQIAAVLRRENLVCSTREQVTSLQAAWVLYALLGAPSIRFHALVSWIRARQADAELNAPQLRPVNQIARLLESPRDAAMVEIIAINRRSGVLTVLYRHGGTLVLPHLTAEPAAPGGVLGVMTGKAILSASKAFTEKTASYAHA